MRETKLIGITGCTNSGKSTLCKNLCKEMVSSIHVSQDDYFNRENLEYNEEAESFNFDSITAIDMDKFKEEIKSLKNSNKYDYVFIDGFIIYEDKELADFLDKKYFISLNKTESKRRRASRQYNSVDTPKYFDKCVWVEFLKYKKMCKRTYKDICYMDGVKPKQDLVEHVLADLERL